MQRGLIKHDYYVFAGVNAFREGNKIPETSLFYALNSRFRRGRWSSRAGYTTFGTPTTGGTSIRGLMNYTEYIAGQQSESIVSYYNLKFYKYNLATASKTEIPPTGWTPSDSIVRGDSYNGTVYVCDGINPIGKISDTTFSVIADAPIANKIAFWAEKAWIVTNDAPATLQYSATASASVPGNIEDFNTVGATGAELIGKGGALTAIKTLNSKLYAIKSSEIEVFTTIDLSGDSPRPVREPLSKTEGSVGQEATVIVENDIWILTPSLQIKSIGQIAGYFSETRTSDMSKIIDRYRQNLDPDQSGAIAWYNDGLYKLALKTFGSSQNNIIFVYDLDTGAWSFDQHTSPQTAVIAGGSAYFGVSGTSGQLYKDESGYSDNGLPMRWGGKTKLTDDGRPDLFKRGRYIYIRGERSEGVVIKVYLLGEDFTRLETVTIPAPTDAELEAIASPTSDEWGQVGDIVGGDGFTDDNQGQPPVVRFNYTQSINSNARMFGAEVFSSLSGQVAHIDDIKIKYIPLPEKHSAINA